VDRVITYAAHALCSCGHPRSVHLVPDCHDEDWPHREPCFVLGCRCEDLSLVCVQCRKPADELISGLWCDACAEAAGEEGLYAEIHHR
jgi:hypothetical protein